MSCSESGQKAARGASAATGAPLATGSVPAVVLTFGKYRGKTIGQVFEEDRSYVEWLAREARQTDVRVAAQEVVAAASPSQSALGYRLTFGRHRGRTLEDVFQEDPEYLEWLAENAWDSRARSAARSILLNPPPVDWRRRTEATARREGISAEDMEDLERVWREEADSQARMNAYLNWREQEMARIERSLGMRPGTFELLLQEYEDWHEYKNDPEVRRRWARWDARVQWQSCTREQFEKALADFLEKDKAEQRKVW